MWIPQRENSTERSQAPDGLAHNDVTNTTD